MRRHQLHRALLCAAVPLLSSVACSTVHVRVPVMKPAEVNMAPYPSVAIAGVHGSGPLGSASVVSSMLEEQLLGAHRFEVVDRQHMNQNLRELQLSASDLADSSKAAQLGKQVGASALIYGTVDDTYREDKSQNESGEGDKKTTTYKLHGVVTVHASFKVVDVATGRVLVVKSYEERREDTNRGVNQQPEPINRDELATQARAEVVQRFLNAITPHPEVQDAAFVKDSDIPQLEVGIGYAENGDWPKSIDKFNEAVQANKNKADSKKLALCYWDLGLAYEYSGDYDRAISMVQKAYDLSADKDRLGEINHIKQLQSDAKRLAEQTSVKEADSGR